MQTAEVAIPLRGTPYRRRRDPTALAAPAPVRPAAQQNLEKFVWSSRRKIAKEKSENSDAMRTLKDAVERR
jgi:hypothetical protein